MTRYQIIQPTAFLREIPGQVGGRDSQLYYGELFDVAETRDGMAQGTSTIDGYPGWIALDLLSADIFTPTHRIASRSAFIYPAPDVKNHALAQLPFGAFIEAGAETKNGYRAVKLNGQPAWIWQSALRPVEQLDQDPVAVAEALLGVPYLWSGRTAFGIDCSGLVQLCLSMCGIAYPRDAYQQEALGTVVAPDEMQRGDLLFAKGHVAIAIDHETVIHANEEINSFVMVDSLKAVDAHYNFHTIKRPERAS